ncbi:MAG TPA: radical SAM protein, partial [Thermoanaerobaculia bacterium]|nr:radical SAM protein [Thermoanaerobaculia bacterium]
MLRTSSYTIYVDLPGNEEEMLLVHTYTGAFDRVSRRVATWVRSLEAGRPPKPLYGEWTPELPSAAGEAVPPTEATIEVLHRRGYLTPMSREEEEAFFTRYVEKLHTLSLRRWPTYLFMPTYDCNLRCGYCFQDHMRTDGRFAHLLRRMTPEMADRLFAAMPKIEALHGIPADAEPQTEIGFFGGEPLLAANRPLVEHVIRRGLARGKARFWAISNGTELDA